MFKRYILLFCVLTAVAIFPTLCEEMPVVNDEKIVVLDDQPDMLPEQEKHFVQTDPRIGITEDDAEQVISILTK